MERKTHAKELDERRQIGLASAVLLELLLVVHVGILCRLRQPLFLGPYVLFFNRFFFTLLLCKHPQGL
jgi:hypothetical protein